MQSLTRFMQILHTLSLNHSTCMRLTDIARATNLSKATTIRLLESLWAEGMVHYNQGTKNYSLGKELMFLGLSATRSFSFDRLARPFLDELASKSGDGIFCCLRTGNHLVCTDRVFGNYPVKVDIFSVGARRPLGVGASGMAILGTLPQAEAERICMVNAAEILKYPGLNPERLLREVIVMRAQGYCFTESHIVEGISAIGVPIRGSQDETVGGLAIVAVANRFANGRKGELAHILLQTTKRLQEAICNDDTNYNS